MQGQTQTGACVMCVYSNQAPEEHNSVRDGGRGSGRGHERGSVVAEAVVVVGVVAGPGIMEVAGSVNQR